ncbi:MAG: NAD(P)/FAD-dependent oxidoreductase [Nonlabens sp.]|nr:NAD(P)/FAD-dependent oxidoreductase [Nonlabens sp.]
MHYLYLVHKQFDIIIAGGGLSGLTAAILLSKTFSVLLVDPDSYPRHKMCGEYLSNEVFDALKELGVSLNQLTNVRLDTFELSSPNGKTVRTKLPLGGTGISRYTLDFVLYKLVIRKAQVLEARVQQAHYVDDHFQVVVGDDVYRCKQFIMATGKRSALDKTLNRDFIFKKSPWLAVKMHYQFDMPANLVQLHNFDGGYAGLSKIENDLVNCCYLVHYDSFKKHKDINTFQEQVMAVNPQLDTFFNTAVAQWEKPITISQISFEQKQPVEDRIMMIGDTAGLIHPLCGNGMAMAIHSAIIASKNLTLYLNGKKTRDHMLIDYSTEWNSVFASRLQYGRYLQRVLLSKTLTNFGYRAVEHIPFILPAIIKQTHGKPVTLDV